MWTGILFPTQMFLRKSLLRNGRHDLETLLFNDSHVFAMVDAFQYFDCFLGAVA